MSRDLPEPATRPYFLQGLPDDHESWLDQLGLPDGLPFLLSPRFEYDAVLNSYFFQANLLTAPWNSNANRARALARWLNFLTVARAGTSWRSATEADHLAFHQWRRRDDDGPGVMGGTWNQEVSLVNQFYEWAVRRGYAAEVPIPQRARRPAPMGSVVGGRETGSVPATYAHDENGERIEWMTPIAYRLWRDVGLRGYGTDGLPSPRFRGRWAARNATFTDFMVRTGQRLSEQAHLTVFEIPMGSGLGGYQRFWLPGTIAKNHSARWIYVPHSVVQELVAYLEWDRADVVEAARAAGRYQRIRRPLVIEDPQRPEVVRRWTAGSSHRLRLRDLSPAARRRLMRETPDGLEPAMLWLNEDGLPMSVSGWKAMFAAANDRCRRAGAPVAAHAHLLRHSFAVVTLEQLQRAHIAQLGELSDNQRGHYVRIFGDPLDWVRRRLGHVSVVTTLIYLHALQELEMETRMALVPDTWEDPRDTPLSELAGDGTEAEPVRDGR
ncbi:site-specific integrase [Streptomyces sp. NBC_01717]|uniref:site-specific integrase n=1 Tax=Streptomyces sp. NBC_01717 TaxID=2975918 RepID=UPI002E3207B9|nr:site-specific integrase [Streptomyces sp. NBC_01717]